MVDFPVQLGDEFYNSDVGISKTSMLDFQKLRWHLGKEIKFSVLF